MKKKLILYIHHGSGLGGAPLSLLYLIQGLDRSRYQPLVLFLKDSDVIQLFQRHNIATLGPLHIQDFSHTAVEWFGWYQPHHIIRNTIDTIKTLAYIAPRILKKVQPDIIHLNTSSLIAWGIVAKLHNIPVVWHIRESLAQGYFGLRKTIIQWIIAQCATRIVAICKTDGQPWKDNPHLKIIYNAADTQVFFPVHTKLSSPNILFVGGIAPQKGLLFLLEVFEQLLHILPNVTLTLAGHLTPPNNKNFLKKITGRYRYYDAVSTLIKKLNNNLIIIGPTHDIPTLMAHSTLVVFPASVDHFARPAIEAQLMQKLVIASDLPQLQEIITHNKTGLLLPFGNHTAWINALHTLLINTQQQHTLANEGYKQALSRFTLAVQKKDMQNLYNTIITQRK